ncbi:MAG: hypothetical protein COA52_10605 [Hyphomicrobiales bacterium]|nr:MAG: hypothetical protein COA52_10605 [Hyphomicrobiales bacterium]
MLVLVAVDDPGLRQTITQSIQIEYQNFVVARSASQVFDALSSHNPDIVLLDAWLPETDTRQMICAIQEQAPRCKIIVMSRRDDPASIRDALSWGAANYLELNRSEAFIQLQLRCLLSGTQAGLQQMSLRDEGAATSDNPANGFFNNDAKMLAKTQEQFEKTLGNGVPVIIEGATGSGKATLARHLIHGHIPQQPGFEFSASSDSMNMLQQQLAARRGKQWVLVKHVENATPEMQQAILGLLDEGHFVVATTRGRLMDHVIGNRICHELYSRLCTAPIWVEKVEDRPADLHLVAQAFLKEAIQLMQVQASNENRLLQTIVEQRFANGFWGLRQRVFLELLSQQTEDKPEAAQNADLSRGAAGHNQYPAVVQPVADFASIKLLDGTGQIRPLADIEDETVRFALEHLGGRLGKVAKALGLGRTTLYRKMTQSSGIKAKANCKTQKLATTNSQIITEAESQDQPAGAAIQKPHKNPAKAA